MLRFLEGVYFLYGKLKYRTANSRFDISTTR